MTGRGDKPAPEPAPAPGPFLGMERREFFTAAQFPDAQAQPWIEGLLPGNRVPRSSTTTSSTTTTAPAG